MTLNSIIHEFLETYPYMSLMPSSEKERIVEGLFPLHCLVSECAEESLLIKRDFFLRICIPVEYPNALPVVYELEKNAQIETSPDFHKRGDCAFCLGSPLALFTILDKSSSLVNFANQCIKPYLVSAIMKKERNMPFAQGELKHYNAGLEQDFEERYGLACDIKTIQNICELLGKKKGNANKCLCPCGSKKRLGSCRCKIHQFISSMRKVAEYSRGIFRNTANAYKQIACS